MSRPTTTPTVNIVGAGIVGSVAARLAVMKTPFNVRIFADPAHPPASEASGGVMNTSWLSGLPAEMHDHALRTYQYLLRRDVLSLPFKLVGKRVLDLQILSPEAILVGPGTRINRIDYRAEKVTKVGAGWVMTADRTWVGPTLVATGAWTGALLYDFEDKVKQKAGVSFRLSAKSVPTEALVKIWAPYRQVVVVPHAANVLWAGDGTSIDPDALDPERVALSLKRVTTALGPGHRVLETRQGIRALLDGNKHGFCGPVMDGTWAAFGAHKNGWTLAPSWATQWIKEAL